MAIVNSFAEFINFSILCIAVIYSASIAYYFLLKREPYLDVSMKKIPLYFLASMPIPIIVYSLLYLFNIENSTSKSFIIIISASPVAFSFFVFVYCFCKLTERFLDNLFSIRFYSDAINIVLQKIRNKSTPTKRIGFIILFISFFVFLLSFLYWLNDYYGDELFDTDETYGLFAAIGLAGFCVGFILFWGYAERLCTWIKTGK
jgi:hypothetical protein